MPYTKTSICKITFLVILIGEVLALFNGCTAKISGVKPVPPRYVTIPVDDLRVGLYIPDKAIQYKTITKIKSFCIPSKIPDFPIGEIFAVSLYNQLKTVFASVLYINSPFKSDEFDLVLSANINKVSVKLGCGDDPPNFAIFDATLISHDEQGQEVWRSETTKEIAHDKSENSDWTFLTQSIANLIRNWSVDLTISPQVRDFRLRQKNTPPQPVLTGPGPIFQDEKALEEMRSEKRIALAIGNSDYTKISRLKNPTNDALFLTKSLQKLGFEVFTIKNGTRLEMMRAIDEFGEKLSAYDVGLFYYSGHGVQIKGNNFLLPVEVNPRRESEIQYTAVDLGYVLSQFDESKARVRMVILDACRDNPFPAMSRSITRGLAGVSNAPRGTLIVYATSPNKLAMDGEGKNGLFTSELMQHIETQGLKIEDLFKRVAIGVEKKSKGEQIPWIHSSFRGDFFFKLPE